MASNKRGTILLLGLIAAFIIIGAVSNQNQPFKIEASYADGNILVTYTITGDTDTTIPVKYEVYRLNETTPIVTKTNTINFTAPQTSINDNIPVQIGGGTYKVRAILNYNQTITEADYTNNTAETTLIVPDWTVTNATAAFTKNGVEINYTITGNVNESIPVQYDIFEEGNTTPIYKYQTTVDFSKPSQNYSAKITPSTPLHAGNYYAKVTINYTKSLTEADYDNDTTQATFVAPDFTVTEVNATLSNGTIHIDYTVTGNSDVTLPVKFEVYAENTNGSPVAQQTDTISFTKPSQSYSKDITINTTASQFIVRVTINYDQSTAETNYDNDTGEATTKGTDFTITDINAQYTN